MTGSGEQEQLRSAKGKIEMNMFVSIDRRVDASYKRSDCSLRLCA